MTIKEYIAYRKIRRAYIKSAKEFAKLAHKIVKAQEKTISLITLGAIDSAMSNYKDGIVSEPIELIEPETFENQIMN